MQVECVPGLCTIKHMCANQRLQNRISTSLALGSSQEKGIVLLTDQAIAHDDFIIQYTDEVITEK